MRQAWLRPTTPIKMQMLQLNELAIVQCRKIENLLLVKCLILKITVLMEMYFSSNRLFLKDFVALSKRCKNFKENYHHPSRFFILVWDGRG